MLYLAGCYDLFQDGVRFTILTTAANDSVLPIHDRMPLILEPFEVESWIMDNGAIDAYMGKQSMELLWAREFEQTSLFDFL